MQISEEKILEFFTIANGDDKVFKALIKAYSDGQEAATPEVTVTPFTLPEPTPIERRAPFPWEVDRPMWQQPIILSTPEDLKPPYTITCRA